MNKLKSTVNALIAVSVSWSALVSAQEAEAPAAAPVELYSCEWQEGKGMEDLTKVNAKFNKWADSNDAGYSAWVITPNFRAVEGEFDVGWIGTWPDGAAFAKGQDAFRNDGVDMAAEFNKVIDCTGSHTLLTSVPLKMPDIDNPSKNPKITFSSCTVDEDSNMGEAMKAHQEMSAYMTAQGSRAAAWLMFPALGTGDTEFDYYLVVGHPDYASVGATFETISNGGGWMKAAEIMGGKVDCDVPRLYDGTLVRAGGAG